MAIPIAAAIAAAAATAASGGLGYLSTVKTNKTNKQINDDSLQAAYNMQSNNIEFQKEMWNASNEYNSPSNQKALYQAAGLNPYAMMGDNSFAPASSSVGSSQSPPSSIPMQSYQPNFTGISDAINSYYDNRIKEENVDMLRYQNDVKEQNHLLDVAERLADLEEKGVKTESDRILRDYYQTQLEIAAKTKNYKVSQARSDAEFAQSQADTADWNLFYSRFTSNLDYRLKEQGVTLNNATINKMEADVREVYQRIESLRKNNQLTDKEIEKAASEIAGIVANNEHNKKLYPLVRQQTISEIRKNRTISFTDNHGRSRVYEYNPKKGKYVYKQ